MSGKPINELGRSYGRLTVVRRCYFQDAAGRAIWRCRCACGKYTNVLGADLRVGRVKSCGCLRAETIQNATLEQRSMWSRLGGIASGVSKRREKAELAVYAE